MPPEIALGGVLVPGLVVLAVLSLPLLWLVDWAAGRSGLYRQVWHPQLFRVALFLALFAGIARLTSTY